MTPERWQQIKTVFQQALERDVGEREAWLAQACDGDETLRGEVEKLLKGYAQAGSFIETPARQLAAEAITAPAVLTGRQIGHYRVLAPLGAGGMGEVYLAEDDKLARQVAIKFLPTALASDEQAKRRLLREARAAAALDHPNICAIHEIGEAAGRDFIVMQYVKGETLAARSTRASLPLPELLDIAIQVAEALQEAHQHGVIHRDIKPQNVMLTAQGHVKVLDFGLAKVVGVTLPEGDAESLTTPGALVGTVHYMSPEQVRGQAVDARTDIFSFGVMLYRLVAGKQPFTGETSSDVLAAILRAEPLPLSRHWPAVPAGLEQLIGKALAKERDARQPNAAELLAELRQLKQQVDFTAERERALDSATAEVGPARITTRPAAAFNLFKRHARGAMLALLLGVVALAGFGLYFWRGQKRPAAASALRINRLTTNGKARSATFSPDGRYVAFVVAEGRQHSLWLRQMAAGSNVQIAAPAATDYRGLTFSADGNFLVYAAPEADSRGLALYQMPALGGLAHKLLSGVDSAFTLAPDGRQVAFVRDERALIVANLDGSGERVLAQREPPELFEIAAWSPDGKRIACAGLRPSGARIVADVVTIETASGAQTTLSQPWDSIVDLAWLPDGGGLVLSAGGEQESTAQLWRVDYPGGATQRITTDLSNYGQPRLTADGKTLVATQSNQVYNLWLVPVNEPQRARQLTHGTMFEGFSGLAWTPDNQIVYSSYASGRPEVWRMQADGSQPQQLTAGLGSNALGLDVSPDGRYVVFVTPPGEQRGIWRIDLDGAHPQQLTQAGLVPLFTPDSQWIFYRNQAAVWKVPASGGAAIKLTGPYAFWLDVSPDGKWLAYRDAATKKIGIAPADGGAPLRILDALPNTDQRPMPRWTPDGRALSFLETRTGGANVYLQPLEGDTLRQVTDFKDERIHYYAWSPDGRQLVCSRGHRTSDIVLISNFQ